MIVRRSLLLPLLIAAQAALLVVILSTGLAKAANVGNNAPLNGNSTPNGAHVFFPRISATAGVQRDLELTMYFPAGTSQSEWNSSYLEFSPGGSLSEDNVCVARPVNGIPADRYMTVTIEDPARPGQAKRFNIPHARVCVEKSGFNAEGSNGSNALFARYDLPARPAAVDSTTNHYKLHVTVAYHSNISASDNAGGIRLKASTPTSNAKIGQSGGGSRSFPILAHWSLRDTNSTAIDIPFGYCDSSLNDEVTRAIGIYDADQGLGDFAGNVINFRVYDVTEGRHIQLDQRPDSRGTVYNGGTSFRPNNGTNKEKTYVNVTLKKFHKYEIQINDLHPKNTIDVALPFESIFGEGSINCRNPGAKIVPAATVNGSSTDLTDVPVGTALNFDNFARTIDTDDLGTENFTVRLLDATGNLPPSADFGPSSVRIKPDRDLPAGNRNFSFTPTGPGTYCRETRISNFDTTKVQTPNGTSKRICATVVVAPGKRVVIQPVVELTGGDEVEPEEDTTFTTYANVTNYPRFNADEWGYTNTATKQPADRQLERTNYAAQTTAQGRPSAVRGACTNDPPGPTTCNRWVWTCPNGGSFNQASAPTCPMNYRHVCQGSGGGTVTNTNSSHTCTNRWNCNGTTVYSASQPTCNFWKCRYGASASKNNDIFGQPYGPSSWPTSGAAPVFSFNGDPGTSRCQARCNGGLGDIAGQATGQYFDQGDLKCYERPSFNLTCVSQATPPNFPNVTTTVTVNREGRACQQTPPHRGTDIGQRICMRMTPTFNGWNPVDPRQGTGVTWGANISPTFDEKCKKVVGKPYVRIVGGDIATGIGAGRTAAVCTPSAGSGSVRTQNRGSTGNYSGSGASVTALARGSIEGFASGQFANDRLGGAPTALTFANNTGPTFGGNWGATVACFDASKFTATGGSIPASPVTGTHKVRITGSVFIANNIVYAGNGAWASLQDIPLLQLVVEGDIYISSNVTQLDGLYVALSNGGSGGNIYTCSSGIGVNITGTWGACKRQLVVNGSFVADRVHLSRDCSTVKRSTDTETTLYSGGTDEQHCDSSGRTKAAEVFNFLPDQWIRSSSGVPSSNYDAITNMPPIL